MFRYLPVAVSVSGKLIVVSEKVLGMLGGENEERGSVTLHRLDRAMTDCRPVSLIPIQTVRQLAEEVGAEVDKRPFRANLNIDLDAAAGFAENDFVGRQPRIDNKAGVYGVVIVEGIVRPGNSVTLV